MAEALKTRPAGKELEIDDEAAVVDVRIDRLFGSHNVYEFDRKHGALRLARFVTGDGPCEVEQGAAQRAQRLPYGLTFVGRTACQRIRNR